MIIGNKTQMCTLLESIINNALVDIVDKGVKSTISYSVIPSIKLKAIPHVTDDGNFQVGVDIEINPDECTISQERQVWEAMNYLTSKGKVWTFSVLLKHDGSDIW